MGLFDEWLEAKESEHEPERLQKMHKRFGRMAGKSCGDCRHLFTMQYKRVYFKCVQSHVSASSATDWRQKWQACGKFEQRRVLR